MEGIGGHAELMASLVFEAFVLLATAVSRR